jgi:SAM-dependent methyltransferase
VNDRQPLLTKPDRYKRASLRTYGRIGRQQYDRLIWSRLFFPAWDRAVLVALEATGHRAPVLDVGCGTGRVLAALAAVGFTDLSGADLARNMLDNTAGRLKETGTVATLKCADVEDRLPWPDGSFQLVLLTGVFHHLFRPLDALREIRRVLAPNGRLLLVDPWFPPPLRQLANLYLRLFDHDGDCHMYAPGEAVSLLESADFGAVKARRVSWHSFQLTARAPAGGRSASGGAAV